MLIAGEKSVRLIDGWRDERVRRQRRQRGQPSGHLSKRPRMAEIYTHRLADRTTSVTGPPRLFGAGVNRRLDGHS